MAVHAAARAWPGPVPQQRHSGPPWNRPQARVPRRPHALAVQQQPGWGGQALGPRRDAREQAGEPAVGQATTPCCHLGTGVAYRALLEVM
eukprot:1156610-Pelagomonas_calceolata.AAC.1